MSEVLVVMYHHVHGPAAAHLAGLHGVEQDDFRAQLQALKRTHVPIAYPALRDALDKGETLPERSVLITFDDGTIDGSDPATTSGEEGTIGTNDGSIKEKGVSCIAIGHTQRIDNNLATGNRRTRHQSHI